MNTHNDPHYPFHPAIMLLVAPLMGGLFVIFLPILGFYMVGKVLFEKGLALSRHYLKTAKTT